MCVRACAFVCVCARAHVSDAHTSIVRMHVIGEQTPKFRGIKENYHTLELASGEASEGCETLSASCGSGTSTLVYSLLCDPRAPLHPPVASSSSAVVEENMRGKRGKDKSVSARSLSTSCETSILVYSLLCDPRVPLHPPVASSSSAVVDGKCVKERRENESMSDCWLLGLRPS